MESIARLRRLVVAAAMAGALALLGIAPVSAGGGCGTGECKPWSSPAVTHNGLQTILLIDAGGVVVLGVLLLLVVLYLRKRQSGMGRADK